MSDNVEERAAFTNFRMEFHWLVLLVSNFDRELAATVRSMGKTDTLNASRDAAQYALDRITDPSLNEQLEEYVKRLSEYIERVSDFTPEEPKKFNNFNPWRR